MPQDLNQGVVHSRSRAWLAKLMLMLLSTTMALLSLEVGVRIMANKQQQQRLDQAGSDTRFHTPRNGQVRLGHIVRPALDRRVVYELIPKVETTFRDRPLRVNQDGYRCQNVPVDKPDRTLRIVGLGDSVMFGWGVNEDECYLSRLTKRLNQEHADVAWQVINTAVPGYNTAMEMAVLETRALAYQPDLVIVGYVPNDLGLPNFLLDEQDPWTLRKSFLAEFVMQRGVKSFQRALRHRSPEFKNNLDPARVPRAYRHMVGVDGYRRAMARMKELSVEHGFELITFSHVDETANRSAVEKVNQNLGIPYVSAEAVTEQYMQEHQIADRRRSDLVVSDRDPHPSATGHELLSEALYRFLQSTGRTDQLVSRVRFEGQRLADQGGTQTR